MIVTDSRFVMKPEDWTPLTDEEQAELATDIEKLGIDETALWKDIPDDL